MALYGARRTSGSMDLDESDSIDMNAVNKLFQDAYTDEKQSTIELEGKVALPTKSKTPKYHRTRTTSGYDTSKRRHSRPQSRNNSNYEDDHKSSTLPVRA